MLCLGGWLQLRIMSPLTDGGLKKDCRDFADSTAKELVAIKENVLSDAVLVTDKYALLGLLTDHPAVAMPAKTDDLPFYRSELGLPVSYLILGNNIIINDSLFDSCYQQAIAKRKPLDGNWYLDASNRRQFSIIIFGPAAGENQ